MIISLIASISKNYVIGINNKIPWNIPEDMLWFKKNTINKPVIMGRKTFESIGHPLLGRKNIIFSRSINREKTDKSLFWVNNLQQSLLEIKNEKEIMIIGGEEIYKMFIPIAKKIYLTKIDMFVYGDRFFPKFTLTEWKTIFKKSFRKKIKYSFEILEKK